MGVGLRRRSCARWNRFKRVGEAAAAYAAQVAYANPAPKAIIIAPKAIIAEAAESIVSAINDAAVVVSAKVRKGAGAAPAEAIAAALKGISKAISKVAPEALVHEAIVVAVGPDVPDVQRRCVPGVPGIEATVTEWQVVVQAVVADGLHGPRRLLWRLHAHDDAHYHALHQRYLRGRHALSPEALRKSVVVGTADEVVHRLVAETA
mmetsp:Transcript_11207/g.34093  ORF Transcript_11207/g.34093 Transcript_11207/m.34093 type:complete len:206 (-) Transcript_11207:309-926(-)